VRRPLAILAVALTAVLPVAALAACGSSKKASGSSASASSSVPASDASTTGSGSCRTVAAPKPKGPQHLPKPTLTLDPSKTWTATVTTNCGTFVIQLDVKRAPKTSASFASLARKGFYDDLTFHRIVAGFVIQGGDPLGNGTGGPGYSIVETPPQSLRYVHGVVAMAKAGNEPDGASGSQFFVVTAADANLPPQYALLGKVVAGLDVVDDIGTVPVDQSSPGQSTPLSPVVIESVTIAGR
jgi:cyclophilin family peptidyl-prolyl cis-trans isomerase